MLRPLLAAFLTIASSLQAVDIPVPERLTTIDGTVYTGMTAVSVKPDALSLMLPTGPRKVPLIFLPPEVRATYGFSAIDSQIYQAARKGSITLSEKSGFPLARLDEAKTKARTEGKPLGFVVTWRMYWGPNMDPNQHGGSPGAMAHYQLVYDPLLVLVYVRHEDELPGMPPGAAAGINGLKAGGWAPKMAITTPDASTLIEMVPVGVTKDGKMGGPKEREAVFRTTWAPVEAWYQANPEMVAARERGYLTLAASAAAKANKKLSPSATLSAPTPP